jgi:hypothetical protein
VCDEGNVRFTVELCTDPSGRHKSDFMTLLLHTAHSNLGSQIVRSSVRPRLRVAGRKVQCTLSLICGENASSTQARASYTMCYVGIFEPNFRVCDLCFDV